MAKKVQRYSAYPLKVLKVRYKDLTINCYILGNGKKKVVIYMPLPHSGSTITSFLPPELNKTFTIIAIDIPGLAGSMYSKIETLSAVEVVKITKILLNYLKIRRYSVIGIEYGSNLATSLVNNQEKLEGIILINPIFKRTLVSKDIRMKSRLMRMGILPKLIKSYVIVRHKWESKVKRTPYVLNGYSTNYSSRLRDLDSKVMSDLSYQYYNSDLSLKLNNFALNKVLILYTSNLADQVDYLLKVVGRENVLHKKIEGKEYPFLVNEKEIHQIFNFLLEC